MRLLLLLPALVLSAGCSDEDKSAADSGGETTGTTTDTDSGDLGPSGVPDVEVAAAAMDFGVVGVGARTNKSIEVRNTGTGDLTLSGVTITGGSPVFGAELPADPVVPPGGSTSLPLWFAPTASGEARDQLELTTDDPDEPSVVLDIFGTGTGVVLTVSTEDTDFDTVLVGCEEAATIVLASGGVEPVTVTGIEGVPAESDLSIDPAEDTNGALPWTLASGEVREVSVVYAPLDTGSDALEVIVSTDSPATPTIQVAFSGTGARAGDGEDSATAAATDQLDVVFAVDRSGGMWGDDDEPIELLTAHMQDLAASLDSAGIDYQLAVAVYNDGCIRGDTLAIDPSTPATDIAAIVEGMVDIDSTDVWTNTERQFMVMEAALDETDPGGCNEGLLRDGAGLALVGVSDEPDQSYDSYTHYVSLFQALKADPDAVAFFGIGGDYPSGCASASAYTGMYEAITATGGTLYSICQADWESLMGDLGTDLASVADWGQGATYLLSQPAVATTITVEVDGTGTTSGWSYDAGANTVVFTAEATPAAGQAVTIRYAVQGECPE